MALPAIALATQCHRCLEIVNETQSYAVAHETELKDEISALLCGYSESCLKAVRDAFGVFMQVIIRLHPSEFCKAIGLCHLSELIYG